jgi:predicted DNA-binding transcriptional regulator YafY
MALNKLALIRYKTIDYCLSNRGRKWTLDDIVEKVSEALYEYEGIRDGVSKRTIQLDIQTMRSEKLGYNAPIIVVDKKYYTYEDPKFSITKSKLNHADIDKMHEVVSLLKQLNGFSHFDDMSSVIAKLENNIYKNKEKGKVYIQFEGNPLLKGLGFINPLYQAVLNQTPLFIHYQSFKAKKAQEGIYYPYLLKEYRNRWFLIAKNKKSSAIMTLALDRILEFQELPQERFFPHESIDFLTYYDDVIGVTKSEKDNPMKMYLQFDAQTSPYILTKPFHASQTILKEDEKGIIISIEVVLNFELEREILGFGETIKVLGPRLLVKRMQRRLQKAVSLYENKETEKTEEKSE